ncbi:hypothetical protein EV356DRAFT_520625 [Viridothelium virens]|uniref:Uncharacterized protein n=1 Tax=Viridothelium virens TaxID=1048519 RepID=A0A6A6GWB0_VIRVR|nr:hypothetical protein EV356DRAFT_520625 [Viridothelium virens]
MTSLLRVVDTKGRASGRPEQRSNAEDLFANQGAGVDIPDGDGVEAYIRQAADLKDKVSDSTELSYLTLSFWEEGQEQNNTQTPNFRLPNMESPLTRTIQEDLQDGKVCCFTFCSIKGTVYLGLMESEDACQGSVTCFAKAHQPSLMKLPGLGVEHFIGLTTREIVKILNNHPNMSQLRIFNGSNDNRSWFWDASSYTELINKLADKHSDSIWARDRDNVARGGLTVDIIEAKGLVFEYRQTIPEFPILKTWGDSRWLDDISEDTTYWCCSKSKESSQSSDCQKIPSWIKYKGRSSSPDL